MGSPVPPDLIAGERVTIDELEKIAAADDAAGTPVELTAKVDGDGVPDELKGKTVAEMLASVAALKTGLATSEAARQEADRRMDAMSVAAPAVGAVAPVVPVVEDKAPTDEDIKEMFEKDPLQAMAMMTERSNKMLNANLDQRLGGLQNSTMESARGRALTRFAKEFELFGDQITQKIVELNNPNAMTTDQAWDDMISYVRGQPKNFEVMLKAVTPAQKTIEDAQQGQELVTGAVIDSGRAPVVTKQADLDPTAKEIADGLIRAGLIDDYEEYKKWQ